jgi:hypothetical protein
MENLENLTLTAALGALRGIDLARRTASCGAGREIAKGRGQV